MIQASQFCTRTPIQIQTARVDESGQSQLTALDSKGDQVIITGLNAKTYDATYVEPGQTPPAAHHVGGQEAYWLFDALTYDGLPKEDPRYSAYAKIAKDLMMVSQNEP